MAERRMFAKTIVLSDAFLDMPMSARCFYFTLGMFADDDGFVNNPKAIMRQCGASIDDMNVLIAKKFVILFEDGVIVIKHWRINNYLRNDRYVQTKYTDDKALLTLDDNGGYTVENGSGIPSIGIPSNGIPSIEKDRIGKDRIGNNIPASVEAKTDKDAEYKTEFEELWILYPKKHGKQNALRDYIKARKSGVERNTIEDGLSAYIKYCERTNRFFKDGSTWFHQHSWDDDYEDDLSEVDKSSFSITEYARQMQEEGY